MTGASVFPAELANIDVTAQQVSLVVDAGLYPRDAVYAALVPMLGRAFVFVDRTESGDVRIEVRPRSKTDAPGLRALLGSLSNELLVAATRAEITSRRGELLSAVTRRAVAGAMGPPSLDDLESFDLDGEAFEDPLGIADSWERGHAEKPKKDGA